jgi:UDP-glucuronate 4-epimerase
MEYIYAIENNLGKKAIINFLPLQQGDVPDTHADTKDLFKQFNYKPSTSVLEGIANFISWYKNYYK